MTYDIDLMILLEPENILKLVERICVWGYRESPIPYAQLKERAILVELQEIKIPVISIPDLIAIKKHEGRKQDIADVEHLKLILER